MFYNIGVMDKNNTKKTYLLYTLVYIILAATIVGTFYLGSKSLIAFNGDGFREHYQTLVHYSTVLKEMANNFFVNHRFIVPQMDFVIGEGNDILQTMHFLEVGDPMYALSVFVPKEYMYIFFDIISILKIYLSGIAFIFLCRNTNKTNLIGVLIGATSYSFSGFAIANLTTHPFIITPMIYLPLIITGVEKVLKNEKPYILSISVFLAALTNLYFFYMIVILVIIYSIVRVILSREKFIKLIQIGIYSFIGVLLAGVIVAPMFYALITNSRVSIERNYSTFYPLSHFVYLLTNLAVNNYQQYFGGYGIFSLFAIVMMIKKHNNKLLLTLFCIAVLLLSFPIFSRMFNAFTYETERWLFGVNILICYIIVEYFEDIIDVNKNWLLLLTVSIIYFGICIYFNRGDLLYYLANLIVSICFILFIKFVRIQQLRNLSMVGITMFCIAFSFLFVYSPRWYNLRWKGTDFTVFDSVFNRKAAAIDSLDDNNFFRYSGDSLYDDESVVGKHSSTQFYWSVSSNYISEFRNNVGLSDHSSINYSNYDDRFSLMSLGSIKYFVMEEEDKIIPYGFKFLKTENGYDIYENEREVPPVYGYISYMTKDEWLDLDIVERNEALLNSAIIDGEVKSINKQLNKYTSYPVEYEIVNMQDVLFTNKSITVNSKEAQLDLQVKNNNAGEYYLVIKGLNSYIDSNFEISSANTQPKYLYYKSASHPRYSDRHNFIINLGYYECFDDIIHIVFPNIGEFNYSDFQIVCQPLEKEVENYNRIKNNVIIKQFDVTTNNVKANISIEENEIICMAIPYSKGWKVYANGQEKKLLNVNGQYMGIELEKGEYELEFIYSTPLLKEGFIISIVTLISFCAYFVISKKKKSSI